MLQSFYCGQSFSAIYKECSDYPVIEDKNYQQTFVISVRTSFAFYMTLKIKALRLRTC